jgi:hypothetical protein
MKTGSSLRALPIILCAMVVLSGTTALAKEGGETNRHEPRFYSKVPWGVGFWMEGTVTNVTQLDGRLQFQLSGRFWFAQFPPDSPKQVEIEVHGKGGTFAATVSQSEPFFAMTSNWRAGALRKKGELFRILKTAEERGRAVRFELGQPKMEFGTDQSFTLLGASVVRATDADLR